MIWSIQDEVWAAAPAGDKITSMRAERDADNDAVVAKRRRTKARVAATTEEEAERVGASLLRRIGA